MAQKKKMQRRGQAVDRPIERTIQGEMFHTGGQVVHPAVEVALMKREVSERRRQNMIDLLIEFALEHDVRERARQVRHGLIELESEGEVREQVRKIGRALIEPGRQTQVRETRRQVRLVERRGEVHLFEVQMSQPDGKGDVRLVVQVHQSKIRERRRQHETRTRVHLKHQMLQARRKTADDVVTVHEKRRQQREVRQRRGQAIHSELKSARHDLEVR